MSREDDLKIQIEKHKELIITQYAGKPKAEAYVELFVKSITSDNLAYDIINGYDINNPNISSYELDILGKIVGVDRIYTSFTIQDDIYLTTDTVDLIEDITFFGSEDVIVNSVLDDATFLNLIKYKIALNQCTHTNPSIISALSIFLDISKFYIVDTMQMALYYYVDISQKDLFKILLKKNLLPKPVGVRIKIYSYDLTKKVFGFAENYPFYGNKIVGFAESGETGIMADLIEEII